MEIHLPMPSYTMMYKTFGDYDGGHITHNTIIGCSKPSLNSLRNLISHIPSYMEGANAHNSTSTASVSTFHSFVFLSVDFPKQMLRTSHDLPFPHAFDTYQHQLMGFLYEVWPYILMCQQFHTSYTLAVPLISLRRYTMSFLQDMDVSYFWTEMCILCFTQHPSKASKFSCNNNIIHIYK